MHVAPLPNLARLPTARHRTGAAREAPDAFEAELLAVVPKLRAMAIMFTRNRASADDLLQDAIVLALSAKHHYTLGTNMAAWMYRLMRNRFISLLRRRRPPTVPLDDPAALKAPAAGNQHHHDARLTLESELEALPLGQREALLLVGAAGQSYVEAAEALGCSVGTVKSRVSRARDRLRQRFVGSGRGAAPVVERVEGEPACRRSEASREARAGTRLPAGPTRRSTPGWNGSFGGCSTRSRTSPSRIS